MRRKFKIGQVVEIEGRQFVYGQITGVEKENGRWFYILGWQGDANYDYVIEDSLRALTKRERGK